MPIQNLVYTYPILAAGGSVSLNVRDPYSKYVIGSTTSVTLLADQEFIHTGTPNEGCTFYIEYIGNITSNYTGGITVRFFGIDLTDAQAASRCDITAYYNNGTWNVSVRPDFSEQQLSPILWGYLLQDGTIDTTKLGPHKVTFPKIQQLTAQGYMLRSDSSKNIEEFNVKTSGNILIGDGTTINSVPVSGDITITSGGVTSIGNAKITPAMLAYTPSEYFQAELTLTSTQILALNGTPLTIIGAPGVGKYIEVISAFAKITFGTTAYATNTVLQLINVGASFPQLENESLLVSTITRVVKFNNVPNVEVATTQILENTGINLKVDIGNPTAGDSPIKVFVLYRIVNI